MSRLSRIVDLVRVELADVPGLKVLVGGAAIARAAAPPRIVFVPLSATIGPPVKFQSNPRPLRTRTVTCQVHVWAMAGDVTETEDGDEDDDSPSDTARGRDYDATEDLVHRLYVAIHAATVGSYNAISEEWPTEAEPALLKRGALAVLVLSFDIPVVAEFAPTVAGTMNVGLNGA